MMSQETYVKIQELKKQGWTNKEIGEETGFHPSTIARRLAADDPPVRRAVPDGVLVMNQHWQTRIEDLLAKWPRLLGVSVFYRLRSEGFTGGYSTVTRQLRDVRGPRFCAADRASVPIHTDPGEEAQFDFCDLNDWAERWGWSAPLFCFGMILCWSRQRVWWFTTSQDQHHTFEGMARFFDMMGGVPAACRTDRMGALGRSQGPRFVLHPRRSGSRRITRLRSLRVRPVTRNVKARSSGRSVNSRKRFSPRSRSTGSRPISPTSTGVPLPGSIGVSTVLRPARPVRPQRHD